MGKGQTLVWGVTASHVSEEEYLFLLDSNTSFNIVFLDVDNFNPGCFVELILNLWKHSQSALVVLPFENTSSDILRHIRREFDLETLDVIVHASGRHSARLLCEYGISAIVTRMGDLYIVTSLFSNVVSVLTILVNSISDQSIRAWILVLIFTIRRIHTMRFCLSHIHVADCFLNVDIVYQLSLVRLSGRSKQVENSRALFSSLQV
jgi:hypothetical protein